jgi:hypothetical protein
VKTTHLLHLDGLLFLLLTAVLYDGEEILGELNGHRKDNIEGVEQEQQHVHLTVEHK